MRYWDSSAIVPLVVEEPASDAMRAQLREDGDLVVWWATPVECVSALVRSRRRDASRTKLGARSTRLGRPSLARGRARAAIRDEARRLIRVHDGLRAGDALQLAAALAAAERRPSSLGFVCLDDRLKSAAGREGLRVLP